jgi:hypothetical protein
VYLLLHNVSPLAQDERGTLMQQMQELQAQVEAQQTELAQYAQNDPETLKQLVEATEVRSRRAVVAVGGGDVVVQLAGHTGVAF